MPNVVSAIVPEVWRTILARVYARDVVQAQTELVRFKIGEGGFILVGPNKEPATPVATKTDLESEGTPLTGSATFTNASASVTGVGTAFLAEVSVGDWIKPGPTPSAVPGSAGVPGSEVDEWGQVAIVGSNTSITLTAPYTGATLTRQPRKAADAYLTFRKTLVAADVILASSVPAITEITNIVSAAEANSDQLGNPPEFFELGIFDADGVLVAYVTFPMQTKTAAIQLNCIVDLTF